MAGPDLLRSLRHAATHVVAHAVLDLFPAAKVVIGQINDNGFYCDFHLSHPLDEQDLKRVERRTKGLLREDQSVERCRMTFDEARVIFADQPYKLELIDDLADAMNGHTEDRGISLCRHGTFRDICMDTSTVAGAVEPDGLKLMSTAGVYWQGDPQSEMHQRIYGTIWPSGAELAEYLDRVESARARDHRALGTAGDLFSFSPDVGAGLVLWHPKGAMVRYLVERFSQDAHLLNGYELVASPHIGKARLWEVSGHLQFFRGSMYPPLASCGEDYYLKPMSCPFHAHIFRARQRSYRDLPQRFAEFGTVYRYELSGVLHGLTRVRGFTQDDAHTFCTSDQALPEVEDALRFSLYMLETFGLTDVEASLATMPVGKAAGGVAQWRHATSVLRAAATKAGIPIEVEEGAGAFYGPKLDLKVRDAMGRPWQLSTVQFDFNLPERFELSYTGRDGVQQRPVMIHRALFGSVERFIGLLLEHYGGAFPTWLAPTQAAVLPLGDDHVRYARSIASELRASGYRIAVTSPSERVQRRIRQTERQRIPYTVIVGDREVEMGNISLRARSQGELGVMSLLKFKHMLKEETKISVPRRVVRDSDV